MGGVVSFCSCPVLLTGELSGLVSCYPLRLGLGRERINRRRGGGKVGPLRIQAAVGNRFVVFHGSVFSTAHHVRSVADRDGAIQMLMDGDRLTGQCVPPTSLVELPPLVPDRNRVVLGHDPFGLNGEDPVQIAAPAAAEGGAALGGFHGEASVEFVNVAFTQEAVGGFYGGDGG